jgi:cadmium resistance transport/sequestration family protein
MELILASIIAFASTNIDDIFILALFFGSNRFKDAEVVLGQYVGIIGLITLSLIGSLLGLVIAQPYIGLLGLFPIYVGIKGLLTMRSQQSDDDDAIDAAKRSNTNHILSVASITIANGGDNIGIYVPLFATLSTIEKIIMVLIFLLMVALWCFAAKYITKYPTVARVINKYGQIAMPFVLILLGLYILYESGTYQLLVRVL